MKEDTLQKAVASYLDLKAKQRGFLWFHCPNGGTRHKYEAVKLKACGVKPGVPDCTIILHGGKTIFIELKTATGRLSKAQKEFHTELHAMMAPVYTVYTDDINTAVDAVADILEEHL